MAAAESISTATIKATTNGGVGVLLASAFHDGEFMLLLIAGLIVSSFSYFHDFQHKEDAEFGWSEFSVLTKYLIYGTGIMFFVFYLGLNHGSAYVNVPEQVWGFVAAIAAGKAVNIIDDGMDLVKSYLTNKAGK